MSVFSPAGNCVHTHIRVVACAPVNEGGFLRISGGRTIKRADHPFFRLFGFWFLSVCVYICVGREEVGFFLERGGLMAAVLR